MLVVAALSLGFPVLQDLSVTPKLAKGQKYVWSLKCDATVGGQQHDTTMDLTEEVTGDSDSKGFPVHLTLDNLAVDGSQYPGDDAKGVVSAQNVLQSADSDDRRKMFSALLFVFPSMPLTKGLTWKADFTNPPDSKVSYSYTATDTEKVNNEDTLKVTGTVKDATTGGLDESGTWWVNGAGKVVKFKLDTKNWSVTMGGGMQVDATITGTLKP